MLITPEPKVPQRSDASRNDHKSKGYPSEAAFTMKNKAPCADSFEIDFLKSDFPALVSIHNNGWQQEGDTNNNPGMFSSERGI